MPPTKRSPALANLLCCRGEQSITIKRSHIEKPSLLTQGRRWNLTWSSSEKFGSVNCLNVELLSISFWVECFPIKESNEKGKLSRPGLSSHHQQTLQPESSFLFQDWVSWTSASVSQVEKPLLPGVFFRLTSHPALKLPEYSEFLTPFILIFFPSP